jgi:hypothetical protein
MRRNSATIGVVGLMAMLLSVAPAAAAPQAGDYHGVVNGTTKNSCGGNETEGFFRLKNGGSAQKIVPLGSAPYCNSTVMWSEILAPWNFSCPGPSNRISSKGIPVRNGSFDHSEKGLRFKGSWSNGTTLKGFTRIKSGGCDSGKIHWKMHKL